MAAPQPKNVVIVCPHCATRYQVPSDTVGAKGRQVQCAHCGKAWQAFAEKEIERPAPKPVPVVAVAAKPAPRDPDQMFDSKAEAELDAEFEAEQRAAAARAAGEPEPPPAIPEEQVRSIEEIKAAIAPKAQDATAPTKAVDPAAEKKRKKAFDDRQSSLSRQLPLARVRRILRITGLCTLVLMIGAGFSFRTDIVRAFPDLAGTYEALGMGVNVVGLEFRDVKTLLALRRGADVMQVDARIYSVAPGEVDVPPVVVTLLNDENMPLYEWSVAPSVPVLQSGEVVDFSTQVTAPPPGANRVRLTFASGRIQAPSPAVTQPVGSTELEPEIEPAPAEPVIEPHPEPAHEEAAH
jgi:predicted Zn finger-like uncharacterized protein